MSKGIVALLVVIVLSSGGTAYAIDPIFTTDRYAGISFTASNLLFTCPDGSTYDDAFMSIDNFSPIKTPLEGANSLIGFDSDSSMGMRFSMMDGLTDGNNFKFTGIIYKDFNDPCQDPTHPISFSVIGECGHLGVSSSEDFIFVETTTGLHDLEFIPDVSSMNSACTMPILDVQPDGFNFVSCIPPDVLDKATNTCVSPDVTPVDGTSITGAEIQSGDLIFTLSDDTSIDVGSVVGPQGIQGEEGVGINSIGFTDNTIAENSLTFVKSNGIIQFVQLPEFPTGPQGIQGIQGETGLQGITGETGPQGPIGLTGSTGLQGEQGTQGEQGLSGNDGLDAPEFDLTNTGIFNNHLVFAWEDGKTIDVGDVIGPQGVPGDTGPQGEHGLTGIQGPVGMTGEQGQQGVKGETGMQGLQGIKGDTGSQGPIGDTGNTGLRGAVGPVGPQGEQGDQGFIGPVGRGIQTIQRVNDDLMVGYTNGVVETIGQIHDGTFRTGIPGPDGCLLDEKLVPADGFSTVAQSYAGGTCELRKAKITGYDARDGTTLMWYNGIATEPHTAGQVGDGIVTGERIMVYFENEKNVPIVIQSLQLGAHIYDYQLLWTKSDLTPAGFVPLYNEPDNLLIAGKYAVLNHWNGSFDRGQPILRAGEKVALLITVNEDFGFSGITPLSIWTNHGETSTLMLNINEYVPSTDPFGGSNCSYSPRDLDSHWSTSGCDLAGEPMRYIVPGSNNNANG